jgi:hypothetical protein
LTKWRAIIGAAEDDHAMASKPAYGITSATL